MTNNSIDNADVNKCLTIDEAEIRQFVALARPTRAALQVLYIPAAGGAPKGQTFVVPDATDALIEYVREHNALERNMYWMPNGAAKALDKKAAKADMAKAHFCWQDRDPDKTLTRAGRYSEERARLLAEAAALAIDATFVIDSGNGIQPFYRLAEPLDISGGNFAEYERLNTRVCLGHDSVGNSDRIMKLPGCVVWPTLKKTSDGYPDSPSRSRILSVTGKRYTVDELQAKFPPVQEKESAHETAAPVEKRLVSETQRPYRPKEAALAAFEKLKATHPKLAARLNGDGTGLSDPSGSGRLQSIVGILKAAGFTVEEALTLPIAWPGGDAAKDPDRAVRKSFKGSLAAPKPESLDYAQAMEHLNERHAVTLVGGTCVVIRENDNDLPDFLNKTSFETFHAALKYEYEATDGKTGEIVTKTAAAAPAWVKSPLRRTYTGVEFAPKGNRHGYYNLFRGFAVEPGAGDCGLLLAHIRDNLCNGDQAKYDYLIRWLADLFQNPDRKPGVAVSISGAKGVGKSKLIEVISALLGTHAVTVAHSEQLTGRFNAHHATALLIAAEEAFWAGDKKAEGALKHMVTSEKIALEKKGVDIAMVDNYSRFMFVGNAEWLFPATDDERRLFALTCGDAQRKNFQYFAEIDAQLYGGEGLRRVTPGVEPAGLRAFLALLMRTSLTGFEIRDVPETDGLKTQRAANLEPHFQFFYDAIAAHELAGYAWKDGLRIDTGALYDAFVEQARKRGVLHPCDRRVFGLRIGQTFGWGKLQSSDDRRYWKVASWAESKAAFEASRKVSFDEDTAEYEPDLGEEFSAATYLQKFTKSELDAGFDLL